MSKTPTELVRLALNGPTMGTRWSAICFAPADTDAKAVAENLHRAVTAVDDQMSTYKPQSALMRFNAASPGVWCEVPDELLTVLDAGLHITRRSGGAFEMAVGEAVARWGFGPEGQSPASKEAISPVVSALGVLDIDRPGHRLRKSRPLALDLNGIAKGYGVDRLAETLEALGLLSYLVSIDGEVRAGAAKPDGTAWGVAVEKPEPGRRETEAVVPLVAGALATSGDYRHRIEVAGQVLSHTIDPATGAPLANKVAAATVRAATCMVADAWATVMMVMGPERGRALAAAEGIEVMFAVRDQ